MAANQTIIEAASKAYAVHKTDMSGQIKMMAQMAKQLTTIVKTATDATKELDSTFNVLKGLDNKALINMALEKRNDPTLSQADKVKWFQEIKKASDLLEEWSIDVNSIFESDGELISGAMDEDELSWLASIRSGKYFEYTYNIDVNKNNVIDDSEKNLQPLKIENDQLLILDREGNYINVNKLKSSKEFARSSDSDDFIKKYTKSRDKFKGNSHEEVAEYVKTSISDYKNLVTGKEIRSMAYDKTLNVNGEDVYFYEHFLNEYAITEADESIKEQLEAYQNDQMFGEDSEGRMPGEDGYEPTPVFMSPEEKKIMAKMLFKQIAEAENLDLKAEVLKWVELSLTQSITNKYSDASWDL